MNAYKQHFVRLAVYNRWASRQLLNKLDEYITDVDYRADSGLFFRSIHGTLVHLLLSSRLWYARLNLTSSCPLDDGRLPFELDSYWSRSTTDWEQAVNDRHELSCQLLLECDGLIMYVD
jgi:uncharacterized damage-inducible protein DinB